MTLQLTLPAVTTFAGQNADGSARGPSPADAARWGTEIERLIWALIAEAGDLTVPNLLIRYTVTGGTANAITASPNLPLPAGAGLALFSIGIAQANTGNVTINGKPLLTNGGEQIAAGEILPGDLLVFLDNGDHFRLIMDTGSLRNKLAAEAAQALAEAWAEGTIPGGAGTKSSREWSIVSSEEADRSEAASATALNTVAQAENLLDAAQAAYVGFEPGTFYDLGRVTDPIQLFPSDLGRVTAA